MISQISFVLYTTIIDPAIQKSNVHIFDDVWSNILIKS